MLILSVANQGLMRVNGRDRGTSQARLETQERKAHGNSMETPEENDKIWTQRFQADRAQTESTREQKTPQYFNSQKLMEMMMKEFFQRKEEDQKWEKKEKPDSA